MANIEEPIAIVGIGCRFPQSENVNEFWKVLEEGIDTTSDVPPERFSLKQYGSAHKSKGKATSKRGAFILNNRDFDAPFFNLSPKEAAQMDPQIRMLLESTWNAIEDAGIIIDDSNRECGVYVGHMTQDFNDMQCRDNSTLTSHAMQGNAVCMAANRLSFFLNVHGPSIVVDTACSSGLVALSYAVDDLRKGVCKWCLAGGCNALLDPRYFVGFTDWGITSPDGRCFSFDVRGNGYVRGEGAAMICLKKLSDAIADNDHIYCTIKHLGVNHDGNKRAITSPNEYAQLALMQRVYREAKLDGATVDYCEAHGTGTAVGDVIETSALKSALCGENRKYPLIIGSVKTNCGHLEGCAGAIGVIKTALSLEHKQIPMNLNFETPNPKIKFDEWKLKVPTRLTPWPKNNENRPRRACVNSFGIGGTNSHVIMEGYDGNDEILNKFDNTNLKLDKDKYCIVLNSKKSTIFAKQATNLLPVWNSNINSNKKLNDICYTLFDRRHQLTNRCGLYGTANEIATILKELSDKGNSKRAYQGFAIENVNRPVAFVFCGQGAQWNGMGMDLYQNNKLFHDVLDECCRYCDEIPKSEPWKLLDQIQSDNVNNTRVSQPATTAIQIALVDLLKSFGITPNAVVGHSSGEIAAAYAAGIINRKDAMLLAYYRGECITDYAPKNGSMAAIAMNKEDANEYLKDYPHVLCACYNSPNSITISGDIDELNEIGKDLSAKNQFYRQLKVTHAFHSRHMDVAMPPYKSKIENIHTNTNLTARFFSSLREQEITDGNLLTPQYFVENLTHPVGFCKAMQTMENEMKDIAIIELGPHPTLKGPILQTLSDEEMSMRICGTLTRNKDSIECFYESFLRLHVNGCDIHQAMSNLIPKSNFYYNLPNYPYDRQYLWNEAQVSTRFRELDPAGTLVGRRNVTESPSWDVELDVKQLPYMKDHNIGGSVLAPGAMYVEMCLAAARDYYKSNEVTIYNGKFLQALILPNDEYVSMRTTLDPKSGEMNITSNILNAENPDGKFIHYFHAFVKKQADKWNQDIIEEVNEAEMECNKVEVSPEKIYATMHSNGLNFGPTFQTMKRLRQGIKKGIVDVEISAQPELYEDYVLHPTLIDTIFQSMISTVIGGNAAFLPTSIGSLSFDKSCYSNQNNKYTVYVKQKRCDKKLVGDVWLYSNNKPFLWGENIQLTRVETVSTDKAVVLNHCINDVKYEEVGIVNKNDEHLDSALHVGLLCDNIDNSEYTQQLQSLLKDQLVVFTNPNEINVSNCSALIYIGDDKSLKENEPMRINSFLAFVQTIIRNSISIPLYIVTIGCNANPKNISYSGLIGFGRTIISENPNIKTQLVDLDYGCTVVENLHSLFNVINREICDSTDNNEIFIRNNYIYATRILPRDKIVDKEVKQNNIDYYIDIEKPGLLDTFIKRDFHFRTLADHEILVKVDVCGLSYKDVMIAMGLLKEEAFKDGLTGTGIGVECSGTIVSIGPNCTGDFKVGDKVFAMLSSGISTHTIAYDTYVYHIPKNITATQAAGLYVPFVTAYASLVYHGKINENSTVLIHAGSGGVGSCAIQIAKKFGAKIITTVSNDMKKEYVKQLGADYVYDSRSMSFVQDIKKLTQGKGVDIILNSLNDKMMYESVRLLAPYGRFIEIGKVDAMNDNYLNIHDFLENGSYFLFDLDRYVSRHHILGHEWGNVMVNMIEKGEFVPPPIKEFPVNQVEDAFRYMVQAKHMGKICIRITDEKTGTPIECNNLPYKPQGFLKNPYEKTIVIVGARGIGLNIFQYLFEHYCHNFILLSKSGKLDDKNMLVVNTLREKGCIVKLVAADVGDKNDLFKALDDALVDMPPLYGVVHSAMYLQDMLITNMNAEKFHLCYDIKANGAFALHEYETQKLDHKLDFFILLSSISSVIGNRGQCNYCAGNFYMEALVYLRKTMGLAGNILNLGAVGDVGAVARDTKIVNKDLKESMININQILSAIQLIFDNMTSEKQIIVDKMTDSMLSQVTDNSKFKAFIQLRHQQQSSGSSKAASGGAKTDGDGETAIQTACGLTGDERKKFVESNVKNAVASVLGLDVSIIRPEQALSAIGIDSIVSVELSNWIKEQYEVTLSVFDLTSGKTVAGLIDNMMDAINDRTSESSGTKKHEHDANSEEIDIDSFLSLDDIIAREPAVFVESSDQLTEAARTQAATITKEEVFEYPERFDITTTQVWEDERTFEKFLTINPYFITQTRLDSTTSDVGEYTDCVNYCSYDYLGLNFNEKIHDGVKECVDLYGTSAGASRLAGGQIPIHEELEHNLAEFIGTEACILYLGGHTTNVNAIKALCDHNDLVIVDELSHNSILEGAIYSQATRMTFKHNDPADLEQKLKKNRSKFAKVLIAIEGCYSMDGDIPDLPTFIKVKRRYNSILMVDEAHSIGTLGKTGHGIAEHFGINPKSVDMWMGSLGKAFVSAGGYIGGTKELITILRYKSPGFVFSIGMPPPQCAAILYSLKRIIAEPERVERLRENIAYFQQQCLENGIDIGKSKGSVAPVVPVMIYDTQKCLEVIRDLKGMGVFVGPGIYPACELDRARLRFFISAAHTKEQLDKTVNALATVLHTK